MGQLTIYPAEILKCVIVAGQDETMDDTITIAAMTATDRVVAVCMLSATYVMGQYRNDDFSCGAGAMNVEAHAQDTTGLFYLVVYEDIP